MTTYYRPASAEMTTTAGITATSVTPANAGVQLSAQHRNYRIKAKTLDSRFRGNDNVLSSRFRWNDKTSNPSVVPVPLLSPSRKRGSSSLVTRRLQKQIQRPWIPAFAGMTSYYRPASAEMTTAAGMTGHHFPYTASSSSLPPARRILSATSAPIASASSFGPSASSRIAADPSALPTRPRIRSLPPRFSA